MKRALISCTCTESGLQMRKELQTKTPLGQLAGYVLNLGEKATTNPPTEFYNILRDMNQVLRLNAENISELPDEMVRPRKFIEKCPRHYFSSASPCRWWIDWPTKYKKLAAILKASGEDENAPGLKSKKRTRTDVPNIMLNDYIVDCVEKNTSPDNDDCWRYLETHHLTFEYWSDRLIYKTLIEGKEKPLSRDQMARRLNCYIKEWKPQNP